MSTEHVPPTLAEAIATETGETVKACETVALRSLDEAEVDDDFDHTSDEHAVAFENVNLDDAVEIE